MKATTKRKAKPKLEYIKTIVFKFEPTIEERDSIIHRCIYKEQEEFKNKGLKWIVVEKSMETAKIKFIRKP